MSHRLEEKVLVAPVRIPVTITYFYNMLMDGHVLTYQAGTENFSAGKPVQAPNYCWPGYGWLAA